MNAVRSSFLSCSLLASLLLACTPGNEQETGGSNAGGNGGNGGGFTGPTNGGGGEGAGFGTASGGGDVGGGCAGVSTTAEEVPLDIFIMLDKSGSMTDAAAGGGTKWDACVNGLTQFVNQPESAGIGVGIQYFPQTDGPSCPAIPQMCTTDADCGACGPCMSVGFAGFCVGTSDSCEVALYATPAVEIALLPGAATAITSSMNAANPDGDSTTTHPALDGAIDHASEWATNNPGHVVVVVLATDGDPTGECNNDLAAINALAAAGAASTPKILTFVIGVGGSVNALNAIAAAGGTTDAFMIDAEPDVQQAFLDALNQIQGAALPCSYLIPPPPAGEQINYGQVNVSYTPGGGTAETIPKVNDAGSCPASGLAWYYDNNAAPTQILLCPAACETLSADTEGSVEIVLGCATVVQ